MAHGAALALTEALQRGGSPQVSQSPQRMKTTPSKGRQKNVIIIIIYLFILFLSSVSRLS